VNVDIITTEGEQDVLKNLKAKQKKAEDMFTNLVSEMGREMNINHIKTYETKQENPSWL